MGFIKIGGYQWSPQLIQWGVPGYNERTAIKGYYGKRTDGGRGRISSSEIKARMIDLSPVEAVYAIYSRSDLIYVGEGKLGDCLRRHFKTDEFKGRWDSFCWASPWDLDIDGTPPKLKPWNPIIAPRQTGKAIVEQLEAILVKFAAPRGNSQRKLKNKDIRWLIQAVPKDYLDLEEKVDRILALVRGKSV